MCCVKTVLEIIVTNPSTTQNTYESTNVYLPTWHVYNFKLEMG